VKETLAILERAVKESSGNKKLAIVSDIDDTVLGSYDVLEKISYGFYMPYFEEAIHKADFPAIKPMYDVMKFAKKNNITVFYVTGRKKVFQEPTEKNLKEQGFDYFETVFYKPADYREKSVVSYKSGVRKQIEAQGYEVVLSIGDQQSDLSGGHAVSTVKLPNYMYFIP
jgi:predicted secreted acid phosphatase